MQIFLTGATGFVGGHVLRELSARGHQVHVVVRNKNRLGGHEAFVDRVVLGDLHDRGALADACEGATAVVHVAGIVAETRSGDFDRINVRGTENVLAVARDAGSVQRFLQVSSIAAGGQSEPGRPVRESDPARPVSTYGHSKLAAEMAAWRFREYFDVTVVRPPIVYGPWDTHLLPFFKMVLAGQFLTVGNPKMQVSVVHASDLRAGIGDALERPEGAGETFHVAGTARPKIKELVHAIEEATGATATIRRVPAWLAVGAATLTETLSRFGGKATIYNRDKLAELLASGWLCSIEKARKKLEWRPKVDFAHGIRQTAEWYFDKGWLRRPRSTR